MLFCVMYAVFAKFLRMSDGTPTYPVVLLMGISAWQFVQESTSVGLRAIVDRGDLLRKIHFPNYIVVVSSTIGALISFAINFVVVLCLRYLRTCTLPGVCYCCLSTSFSCTSLHSGSRCCCRPCMCISVTFPISGTYCSRYYSTRCRLFTHCRW